MITMLKNYPFDDAFPDRWWESGGVQKYDPIIIRQGNAEFEAAHANWLAGKNPTNDPRWKRGVFASIRKDVA